MSEPFVPAFRRSSGAALWAALAAGALGIAGCSLFHPVPKVPPPVAKALPPPKPVLPKPKATHYFDVESGSDIVGYVQKTVIGKEDTLPDIARRFDVGYEEILTANPGVDPWLPGVGREVVVPTQFVLPAAPHEGVVVNVAAMRIFYYPKHKKGEPETVYTHPIGIGKVGWKTPEGTTKIISRQKDPIWVVPKSVREEHQENGEQLPAQVPAGPDNPLGQYEFRLGWPSYLIHGTNKPYGVGMRSSHGCMRLYPEDIAVFFDLIPIGTKVTVVNQPYLFGWRDGTLYLQAYAVMEDDSRNWNKDRKRLLAKLVHPKERGKIAQHDDEIDWQRVGDLAHSPRAVPVPVTGGHDGVDAVLAQSVLVENTLPRGSNWDGQTGLLVDEKTFNDLLNGRDKAPVGIP
ncbi:MAG TPA: L,D-transpeptidase family protein [Steroidobacteraceae bacterium]|jgi:L,D-transpeptidase ErfK/SrfK|nr:L,D-transpeptidase family protein [Steroidobacteraceae bacterium]